jgi:peptide/nickel transport system substrate-binding protein
MYHRSFLSRVFMLFLLTLFLLAACQPQTPTPATDPAADAPQPAPATDTPAPADETDPADPSVLSRDILLDPALATDADSIKVNQYLYIGLVVLDESGSPQPGIAESWLISDDQLTYTFTIRDDAAFSDGSPITPDVIVDNVNRWLDPESPLRGSGNYETWLAFFEGFLGEKDSDDRPVSPVDGVNKVDFSTVVLHLNRPVPDLLVYMADPAFAILNPASLQDDDYGSITSRIIASGPYQVSSWTNDKLVLTPNPFFWGVVAQVELEFTLR